MPENDVVLMNRDPDGGAEAARRVRYARRYDACAASPTYRRLAKLLAVAGRLSEAIGRFLDRHPARCRCPLCAHLDYEDDDRSPPPWRADLTALANVAGTYAGMVESNLPLPPGEMAEFRVAAAREGGA
jgi:hypothetical protein